MKWVLHHLWRFAEYRGKADKDAPTQEAHWRDRAILA
jgi:hypothetical protein